MTFMFWTAIVRCYEIQNRGWIFRPPDSASSGLLPRLELGRVQPHSFTADLLIYLVHL